MILYGDERSITDSVCVRAIKTDGFDDDVDDERCSGERSASGMDSSTIGMAILCTGQS